MTLRETSGPEIPPHRKYSVSHSGRFKSRPKIRPSLSGELFRPDALETTNNNLNTTGYRNDEAQPKQSPNGPSHRVDIGSGPNPGNPQQMHQAHQQHQHHSDNNNRQRRSSRELLETSL